MAWSPCFRIAWLGSFAGICSVAGAQASDIKADPRLQKPISLHIKIGAITDTLSQISKASGVVLDRSPSIKDLKVTVLVQDVTTSLVLDKIASTLGCAWKADGPTYRLVMTPDEQAARNRYVDSEESIAQKEVADEIVLISKLAYVNPTAARKELLELTEAKSKDQDRIEFLKRAINRQDVMLGRFLSSMSADKVSSFWRGDIIPATPALLAQSLDPTSSDSRLPAPVQRNKRFQPGTTPDGMPSFIQYDPLLFRLRVFQGFGVRNVATRLSTVVTEPLPTGSLAKMPFGKEVLEWDQDVPTDGEIAKASVSQTKDKSTYANGRFSVADFLEKAFDQTHLPIVADAFRVPAAAKSLDRGVGSLSSWLATLKADNHLTTHFEDGFIMVRHGGFWRLRKFETPEELYAELESKVSKTGPTLEQYGAFVSKLSAEQAKPFSLPEATLAKFDTVPLEVGLPALRFYSGLDSQLIAKATENGISYGQMSSSLRQAFITASVEGIFFDATQGSFLPTLLRLAQTGDARGLGFIMRTDQVKVNAATREGQDLVFGATASEATIYRIPVKE